VWQEGLINHPISNRISMERKSPDMILTRENLEALFNCNAPNARQIATLGLRYPLRKGWMETLIGKEINDALYAELMDCKGRRPRGIPKKQWRKPCIPCE
jgi:hypothetical protein